MQLGLKQREIQTRFGLDKETYANWEKDRCQPAMRHWPGIIEFLGCVILIRSQAPWENA